MEALNIDHNACAIQIFIPYVVTQTPKWRRYWYSSIKWSEWQTSFLPLNGGTLQGNLSIKGSIPTTVLQTNVSCAKIFKNATDNVDYGTVIGDYKSLDSSKNGTAIRIYHADETALFESITLTVSDETTTKYYNMYGEHNITKSATDDLISGSSYLNNGCIHIVYE